MAGKKAANTVPHAQETIVRAYRLRAAGASTTRYPVIRTAVASIGTTPYEKNNADPETRPDTAAATRSPRGERCAHIRSANADATSSPDNCTSWGTKRVGPGQNSHSRPTMAAC